VQGEQQDVEGSRPPVGLLAGGALTLTRNVARVLRTSVPWSRFPGQYEVGRSGKCEETYRHTGDDATLRVHVTGEAHFVGLHDS
jgi:hypothetical protein